MERPLQHLMERPLQHLMDRRTKAESGIIPFPENFRVIIPVLDGNVIGEDSILPDRKTEAGRIIKGLRKHGAREVRVLQGISYGATLALEVLMRRELVIRRTVLDGGSFLIWPRSLSAIMQSETASERQQST